MKYYFIVPIAGLGKRMGLNIPKQYYRIKEKPIFISTLEVIEKNKLVDGIYISVNKKDIKLVENYLREFKITKVKKIVEGGSERQYSIKNALDHIEEDAIIAVQDGVRPNIREEYIENTYEILMAEENLDGLVVGVPVKDTVKVIDKYGFIVSTPERKTLFSAHTPQVFRSTILKEAYEKAEKDSFLGTDDSSLVERIGGRVKVYEGHADNVKITTKEDLRYFE